MNVAGSCFSGKCRCRDVRSKNLAFHFKLIVMQTSTRCGRITTIALFHGIRALDLSTSSGMGQNLSLICVEIIGSARMITASIVPIVLGGNGHESSTLVRTSGKTPSDKRTVLYRDLDM